MVREVVNGREGSRKGLEVGMFDGAVRGMSGVMLAGGVHPVDLVNALMDHVISFVAMIEAPHLRSQVCENVRGNLGRMVEARHAEMVRAAGGVMGVTGGLPT